MLKRICALTATLSLSAALLATQTPAAHAEAGGCPAGFVSVGDGPASIGGLGTLDITFNKDIQMWCFETAAASDVTTTVRGRPASWNENWRVTATGTGTIHIGWMSNGGKCAEAQGVVSRRTQQESRTIQRCRV